MQRPLRTLHTRALAPLTFALLAPASLAQVSFTSAGTVTTGARANSPVFADLDGNGVLDMAVTSDGAGNQDLIELYSGNGDGTFTPAGSVFLPNGSSPAGLAGADVDGDGDADLVVVLSNFDQAMVASNNGAFSFTTQPGVGTGGSDSRSIASGDMNGDGSPDFVIGSRDSANVSVLVNSGGALSLVGTFGAGDEPRDIVIGDWNGDGLGDVAAAAHDSRQIAFLTNLGGGSLGAATFRGVPGGARPSGLAAADMDGDGDLDVIAGNGDDANIGQNFVSLYTNTAGSFTGPISFASGGLDTGDVLAGDFDLDGVTDVAVVLESSNSIATLRGLGGGALGAPMLLATGGAPSDLASGDLDGNGSIDLGVSRRQAANVDIFLNDASGAPGMNYCTANANSTGVAAVMSATGSASVALNDLTVISSSMPLNSLGFFITSRSMGFTANPAGSSGNLCLGGAIGRYSNLVSSTGATGQISLGINLAQMPTPTGVVAATAGETWHFQAWFRDAVMGAATSNFSDGLAVVMN
ncbi:FG-GAP repeat protein [Planctomycetes bacterium Poly30]|uniref:FG-GAP repeat protein n=1 Tax=Saltatorellus ferox TaxID=2528018 RepID=A0A518EZH2_9BACT|nr:FG-GAP repeat protein [Planctomycetes bacterium Poly30]